MKHSRKEKMINRYNRLLLLTLFFFFAAVLPVWSETTLYPDATGSTGDLYVPWFAAYNPCEDTVYVVDQKEHRIVVFDRNLNYVDTIGRYGQGHGEFSHPAGIAFDREGNIYICDMGNYRVQVLDRNRNFITSFKCLFNDFQQEIAVDSRGRIFLNLPLTGYLITVFNRQGDVTGQFGKIYSHPLERHRVQLNLVRLTLDQEDNLYCAFQEFPVLRKYDAAFHLLYTQEYPQLPGIIAKTAAAEKKKEISKQEKLAVHIYKKLLMNLSCDREYLYMGIYLDTSNPVAFFYKKDGRLAGGFGLATNETETGNYFRFDASHPDFIFAVDILQRGLHKFKKRR
jgi:hypothetical protein